VSARYKPGLRAIVERLPGGRAALHWVEITDRTVRPRGSFEGTVEEVWAAVERGPPESRSPLPSTPL
jgi:hypothetical protein